ncbi:MAG: sulfurase [Pseudomonadota bacterium]
MTMLTPTKVYGEIAYLGLVANGEDTLRSSAQEKLTLTWDGPVGEDHSGRTRPACVRVKRQWEKGTEIFNNRQVSVLSEEELSEIAADMDIPRIAPEWTGATMVFRGIPELTTMPPASRLIFDSGAAIICDMENGPCSFVAREIEKEHPGKGLSFPKHAVHKRGFCGWVERPGEITVGMKARLHIPPQRIWPHA